MDRPLRFTAPGNAGPRPLVLSPVVLLIVRGPPDPIQNHPSPWLKSPDKSAQSNRSNLTQTSGLGPPASTQPKIKGMNLVDWGGDVLRNRH